MPIFLLILALVSGCSSDVQRAQQALDSYASFVSGEHGAAEVLTGSALVSFENSRQLIQNFGYQQSGSAHFEIDNFSFPKARGCLDLSQIRTTSNDGVLIPAIATPRVLFTATFDKSFLISHLEISEQEC